ncbi:MAG: HEAT repeat domain-containing protein [Planctomycetes bacterium]|nr:HEAT repeat domain-containing protein [Planctomycetota bacterium]
MPRTPRSVCSLVALALAAPLFARGAQDLPPPKQDPPAPAPAGGDPAPEPLRKDLGEPKVERGKAGPDLVIPVNTRQPSGRTAQKRRPDLPDAPARASSAAPAPRTARPAASDGTAASRASISEASSERLVESLATRKRIDDEEGQRVRAELAARGAEAGAALRAGLATKRSEAAVVLAELLFPIAGAEDLALLHRRALEGLTATGAKRFAAGFAAAEPERSDWILAWFDAANPNLRAEAERQAIARELALEPFRERLAHAHPEVRRRALRVLEQRRDPALASAALRLLDDESPPTAQACAALLVAHGGAAEWELLAARVRAFSYDRAWGRAIAALLEEEAASAVALLALEDLGGCAAAFSHENVFIAAAGAAAVGAIGLRCDDERATLWLRERVPHLLVRAIAGEVGYSELPLLRPALLRLLRRMSGVDLGEDGAAWKTWWGRVGGSFTPRREFFVLDPAALGELELHTTYAAGEVARELAFAQLSDGVLASTVSAPQRRWLDAAEMRALHDEIALAGIARAEWPAGRFGESGEERRSIELRRGASTKRIDGSPRSGDARWDRLCAAVAALEERTAWQPYLDAQRFARFADLHAAEAAWWSAAHAPNERRARLRGLIAHAFDDLDPALAWDAYDELERALPSGEVLEAEAAAALLAFVGVEAPLDPLRRAVVELVAKRGAPGVIEDVKTIFALRPARQEERLALGSVLASAGPDAVRAALLDPRPPVLAGAAEAAPVLSAEPPLSRLFELTRHGTAQVRLASIRALGRLGAEASSGPLIQIFERAEISERLEAAEALARLATPSSLAALSRALASDDALVRRAIFQGFAESDAVAATLALASFAVGSGGASADGLRARAACLDKPLDQIRSVCGSLAEATETRRAAALLWAEALDAAALPLLLQVLEETPDDTGVIQALSWLSCRSFTPTTALAEARRFAEAHVGESAQLWFARACEENALPLPERGETLRSSPSRRTLEALCDVLQSGAPELRMHAARYLREALGEDLGYVTLVTDPPTCERIARSCRRLLRERS